MNSFKQILANFKINNSLSTQLLKVIFTIYWSVTIIITLFQMLAEYNHAQNAIREEIYTLEQTFKQPLAKAIWNFNDEQRDSLVRSIYNLKIVSGVQLISTDGIIISNFGQTKNKTNMIFKCKIEDTFNTHNIVLATMKLFSTPDIVMQRVKTGFYYIILATFIKGILLWILLLWAFNRFLTDPIKSLTKKVQNIDLTNIKQNKFIDDDINILSKNELDIFQQSFALMLERIAKSKHELEELNKTLEHKVKLRTNDLEIAKNKAEEITKIKANFLANMSHEIRTPMNGILGMTHLALDNKYDITKQTEIIKRIDSSTKSLLGIINDILDFSKIEAGKLNLEKIDFNINEVLTNIENIVSIKAKEKNLSFKIFNYNENNIYYGDPLRLSQILLNLINNAIKFTKSGSVEVYIEPVGNDKIKFIVQDTGIGMSTEVQSNLFEAFTQADASTTRKYGGTGLGLSICKQLVELMNGDIWCTSEIDVGSKFIFVIDLVKGNEKNIQYESLTHEQLHSEIFKLKNSNILLVDDNVMNQEILLGILESTDINIDIASNGEEAIDIFKQNPKKYNLILMDIQMPIMDGYAATKIIRKIDKDIPIIALTANAMKDDIEKTKKAHMNEHLNKPIDIEKLYMILLKYIPIQNIQNLDVNLALEQLNNNTKLYDKILVSFYEQYKNKQFEYLEDEEFKREIHTLKGLSANIGAMTLHSIAKMVDSTFDRKLLPDLMEELNNVLDEIQTTMETMISNNQDIQKVEIDELTIKHLLISLKHASDSHKPKDVKLMLHELDKYQLSSDIENLVQIIHQSIENYNFAQISNLLGTYNE